MINQGEVVNFRGHFQQKVGDSWTYISNLTGYTVKAMIVCETKNKKLLFSSNSSDKDIAGKITIGDGSDYSVYSFSLTSTITKELLGECTVEIALIDSSGTPLITDDKGGFVVKDSLLGRSL